jgi:hypothetical protein
VVARAHGHCEEKVAVAFGARLHGRCEILLCCVVIALGESLVGALVSGVVMPIVE